MSSLLKKHILNVNIFGPSADSDEREDEQQRRWNIIATRSYFLLLFIILLIVGAVSWWSTEVTMISIKHPTEEVFKYLPYDTRCPCSRGSVSYGDFASLEPRFHQVCSSDFVSNRWIETIFSGSNSTYFYLGDFRRFGSGHFQALASFCRLSMANIQESISTFKLTTLTSLSILSEIVLRQQTEVAFEQLTSIARKRFAAQLTLISQMTVANRLVSGLQTNHGFIYKVENSRLMSIGTHSHIIVQDSNITCDCLLSPDCQYQAVFDESFGAPRQDYHSKSVTVPGMYAGCLPASSILSSTLECFYDQTCVDNLLSSFPTSATFAAMIPSHASIYKPTATVKSMVDRLMIEEWRIDTSYEQYYAQCAPASCTYSQVKRNGVIFALVKIISLLATLTFVLGIVIPNLTNFIRSRLNPTSLPKITSKYDTIVCILISIEHESAFEI